MLATIVRQGHEIDAFGIGTNLVRAPSVSPALGRACLDSPSISSVGLLQVTCKAQPALGCVYKLVQVKDVARIKLSQDVTKVHAAFESIVLGPDIVVESLCSVCHLARFPT